VSDNILVQEEFVAARALELHIVQSVHHEAGQTLGSHVDSPTVRTVLVVSEPLVDASLAVQFFALITHGWVHKLAVFLSQNWSHNIEADRTLEVLLTRLLFGSVG